VWHTAGGAGLCDRFFAEGDFGFSDKLQPDAPLYPLDNLATDLSQTKKVIREHSEISERLAKRLPSTRKPWTSSPPQKQPPF
jgi:hypothetical protein